MDSVSLSRNFSQALFVIVEDVSDIQTIYHGSGQSGEVKNSPPIPAGLVKAAQEARKGIALVKEDLSSIREKIDKAVEEGTVNPFRWVSTNIWSISIEYPMILLREHGSAMQ